MRSPPSATSLVRSWLRVGPRPMVVLLRRASSVDCSNGRLPGIFRPTVSAGCRRWQSGVASGQRRSASSRTAASAEEERRLEPDSASDAASARHPADAGMERPHACRRCHRRRLRLRWQDISVTVGHRSPHHRRALVRTKVLRAMSTQHEASLRGLHPQVDRGRPRPGVQLARCPARGLCCLHRLADRPRLEAGARPL